MKGKLQVVDGSRSDVLRLPGNGDGGDDMEARIARLEAKMDKVDDSLGQVDKGLAVLTERVSHLPSKGFIVGATITALVALAAVTAFLERIPQGVGQ